MNRDVEWLKRNWVTIVISFSLGFMTSCLVIFSLLAWSVSTIPIPTSTVTNTPTFGLPHLTITSSATITSTPTPSVTPFPVLELPSLTPVPIDIVVPTMPEHPYGTSGKCADGTYTEAEHSQGACSHHGGLIEWWGK